MKLAIPRWLNAVTFMHALLTLVMAAMAMGTTAVAVIKRWTHS